MTTVLAAWELLMMAWPLQQGPGTVFWRSGIEAWRFSSLCITCIFYICMQGRGRLLPKNQFNFKLVPQLVVVCVNGCKLGWIFVLSGFKVLPGRMLKRLKSRSGKMFSNHKFNLSLFLRCSFNSKVDWKTITTWECSQHLLQHCLNWLGHHKNEGKPMPFLHKEEHNCLSPS